MFSEKISSNSYWQDIGIFFLIINIFLILLMWTYFYKSKNNHFYKYKIRLIIIYYAGVWNTNSNSISNSIQDDIENLPPAYDSCMKLNNYVTGLNHLLLNMP